MPVELLWQEGLALSSLFKLPRDPWILVKGKLEENKAIQLYIKSAFQKILKKSGI